MRRSLKLPPLDLWSNLSCCDQRVKLHDWAKEASGRIRALLIAAEEADYDNYCDLQDLHDLVQAEFEE